MARAGRDATAARDYPGVELEHCWWTTPPCSSSAGPRRFDVVVTENLFGDILSDEAAMITGSIGLLPSACLGAGPLGLYEPVHGSAPDIAGTGVANPIATCLSAAMMLRYSLGAPEAAGRIEGAVDAVIEGGARTRDLGGELGTADLRDRVIAALR